MADSVTTIVVTADKQTATAVAERFVKDGSLDRLGVNSTIDLIRNILAGTIAGKVQVHVADNTAGAASTGTVTCSQAAALAGDTLTISGITLTVVASSPGFRELLAGASDTEFGDNLEAAIEADPVLRSVIAATNAAGTVTIDAREQGLHGDLITLAETGAGFTVSGANLTGGAQGATAAELRGYAIGEI